MRRTFWMRANRQELEGTITPSAVQVAYAAGFFDGEGTARNCGRGKRSLAVSIPQKDPEMLIRMRDWFGGSVNNPGETNPCWRLDICGDRARIFLCQIFEHLSTRRKEQILSTGCMEFLEGRASVGMSVEELRRILLSFYEHQAENGWNGPNKNIVRRMRYQARKLEDPTYLAKLNKSNQKWKAKQGQAKIVSIA